MSWIQKLYETYNNCQGSIGYSKNEKERPLLPICHITTQAHVEIIIDGDGNFKRANLITNKNDRTTIIPSTEDSSGRSGSKPQNHPLCDKLQYVAGDFRDFGGKVTGGFKKEPEEPYASFVATLSEWCQSAFSHPKAEAVLKYVKKKEVIKDLVEQKILLVGEDGKFLAKKEVDRDRNSKDIFSAVSNNKQQDAFVRWIVEIPGESETEVWKDKSLWHSWSSYYLKSREKESFCFVTGKNGILTTKHPKYIRREGDSAKLISSNDKSGFTYRGRFINDEQACNVSLDVSQKAHYALSWLISRQGYKSGDQVVVAWATSGAEVPQPTDDPISILGTDDLVSDEVAPVDTAQDLAEKLKKKIAGYSQSIEPTTDVIVMGLDSATPGRLAITYYRELKGSDFLKRLNDWHESCSWTHRFLSVEVTDRESGKTKKIYPSFVGAPAPKDIAEAAYGKRVNDQLRNSTVKRILPCIIDGAPIPQDLVKSSVRRASNRIGIKNAKDKYENEWNKTLSIACALFRKFREKEDYPMALDETRTTRDYLYGRLLAIADRLEEIALYKADKNRPTNATRYMHQFSQHPYRTWLQLHDALIPYMVQLGGSVYFKNMIAEIKSSFDPDDFMNDKPLSGEYLLGYYSQRQKLWQKKETKEEEENKTSDE